MDILKNPIVEEKHRVQRELAKQADYDVHKYFELIHKLTKECEKEHNVKFKYCD